MKIEFLAIAIGLVAGAFGQAEKAKALTIDYSAIYSNNESHYTESYSFNSSTDLLTYHFAGSIAEGYTSGNYTISSKALTDYFDREGTRYLDIKPDLSTVSFTGGETTNFGFKTVDPDTLVTQLPSFEIDVTHFKDVSYVNYYPDQFKQFESYTLTGPLPSVPLPSSAPLFGAGLILLAGCGWRTKRARQAAACSAPTR